MSAIPPFNDQYSRLTGLPKVPCSHSSISKLPSANWTLVGSRLAKVGGKLGVGVNAGMRELILRHDVAPRWTRKATFIGAGAGLGEGLNIAMPTHRGISTKLPLRRGKRAPTEIRFKDLLGPAVVFSAGANLDVHAGECIILFNCPPKPVVGWLARIIGPPIALADFIVGAWWRAVAIGGSVGVGGKGAASYGFSVDVGYITDGGGVMEWLAHLNDPVVPPAQ